MDLGLKGRTAFVAGASTGLGLASAVELAAEGCHVAICSRDRSRIEGAAESVRSASAEGTRVVAIPCDVTDESAVRNAIDRTVDELGGLNILVTNAGGPPAGFVDDFSSDDWRGALELNLMSTINLTRYALPHLREAARSSGHGRIIMITSVSAKQPIPNLYLSNVARAGVHGFAKSLAEEVGPEGITVNTILPGYTRTDRLKNLARSIQEQTGQAPEETERDWAAASALKRIGEPNEFGATVAFLASARASYISGVSLPVDGGRIKHLL